MSEAIAKVPVQVESQPPAAEPRPERRHPLTTLRHEIDRLFDDFDGWPRWRPFGRSLFELPSSLSSYTTQLANPEVDFVETDKGYEITAELPGMDGDDIKVTVSDSTLTIEGEKRDEREEKKKGHHVSERRYGAFLRRFRLPDDIEHDKIDAKFKKGVLTVTLPKSAKAKASDRRVEVRSD